jgi:hypothetical protein
VSSPEFVDFGELKSALSRGFVKRQMVEAEPSRRRVTGSNHAAAAKGRRRLAPCSIAVLACISRAFSRAPQAGFRSVGSQLRYGLILGGAFKARGRPAVRSLTPCARWTCALCAVPMAAVAAAAAMVLVGSAMLASSGMSGGASAHQVSACENCGLSLAARSVLAQSGKDAA